MTVNEESPYGVAPAGYRLPTATRVGRVRLQVADLARSAAFYQQVLGLTLLDSTSGRAVLGPAGTTAATALVELVGRRGVRPVVRDRRFGLFHFALLLPDRPALGRFLKHVVRYDVRPAMADHFVSEALYLYDPDGLGIEVSADRPRDKWRALARELWMTTDPLDAEGLVAAAGSGAWTGAPEGTTMGHVHLHVGDLDEASEFYHRGLGFDRTSWSIPGALFFSAGGYHHHLATNTWAAGAVGPTEDEARLLEWEILVPKPTDAGAAARNIEYLGHATRKEGRDWVVRDPWGTVVRLKGDPAVAPATAARPGETSQ